MLLVLAGACVYAVYMIGSGEMVRRIGSIQLVVYASSSSAFFSIAQALIQNPSAMFEQAPPSMHQQGAGSIHHIAWSAFAGDGELEDWRLRLARAGQRPTPMIDRFWFHSVYFRAPDGLLHEFATPEPGFTVDEPLESLGSKLVLPPKFEPYRDQIVARLTPID